MKSVLLVLAAVGGLVVSRMPSVAGEWNAGYDTPGGGKRDFKLVFKVAGDTLSGTVKRSSGDVPLSGTVKADTVRFQYAIDYNGNSLTVSVQALVAGDSMKGTVDFAGADQENFWATRAP